MLGLMVYVVLNYSSIVELAKSLGLPAEGINFTPKIKEEMLSNLKILFEQKKIVIPDDQNLIFNLNCIVAERNRMGNQLFDHAKGTHDDLGYALALAVWGARHGVVIFGIRSDEPGSGFGWRERAGKPSG